VIQPAARNHFGAVALNGFAYAVGGQTRQDLAADFHADVFRYDPASNKWGSVAGTLAPARSHANATTIVHKGRILIMGGEVSNFSTLGNVEAYDPSADKWSVLTSLPRRTTAGIAGSFGDRVIFTTGNGGGQFRGDTYLGTFS
jgi:N-acetylneuraminic acid mutarotase